MKDTDRKPVPLRGSAAYERKRNKAMVNLWKEVKKENQMGSINALLTLLAVRVMAMTADEDVYALPRSTMGWNKALKRLGQL